MKNFDKQSRFKYAQSEKDTLKVLKMQENDLQSLSAETSSQSKDLDDIRRRAEAIAAKLNVSINPRVDVEDVAVPNYQIRQDDIPTWDSLVNRANREIKEDVIYEDLLTRDEFNYCIDDVRRINEEFAKRTKLSKVDLAFLVIATALQTVRWVIINKLYGDLGESFDPDERLKHNDKEIKDDVYRRNKEFQDQHSGHGHRESQKGYKSWEEIIFKSAPYDVTVGSPDLGINMEGKYHRYKTLGHDPILGWIFGSANFITDTITLSNFSSYRIQRNPGPRFGSPISLFNILYETWDSTKEDWLRLPAGVFAQYVHLKSDEFTKCGLPVPLLEVFSEELAGELYKSQYDSLCLLRDIKIVGRQAALSIFINMIVSLVHGLFYNPSKDGERKFYEARTRKVLLISNALSSVGNIAYCAITEDFGKLDLGGLLVTISRLFTDIRFITRLKDEFIQQEIDKSIQKELEDINSNFI